VTDTTDMLEMIDPVTGEIIDQRNRPSVCSRRPTSSGLTLDRGDHRLVNQEVRQDRSPLPDHPDQGRRPHDHSSRPATARPQHHPPGHQRSGREALICPNSGHEHGESPLGSNIRNGTRSKTVLTEIGPVEIEVPRDRDGSFEPVIVPKRKRRLDGIDQIVLSLSARGLTTGEIAAHFLTCATFGDLN